MKPTNAAKYEDLGSNAPTYRQPNLPTGPRYYYTVARSSCGDAMTNANIWTQLFKNPTVEEAPHLYKTKWGWSEDRAKQKQVAYSMVNKRAFKEPIYVHCGQGTVRPSMVDFVKILYAMEQNGV